MAGSAGCAGEAAAVAAPVSARAADNSEVLRGRNISTGLCCELDSINSGVTYHAGRGCNLDVPSSLGESPLPRCRHDGGHHWWGGCSCPCGSEGCSSSQAGPCGAHRAGPHHDSLPAGVRDSGAGACAPDTGGSLIALRPSLVDTRHRKRGCPDVRPVSWVTGSLLTAAGCP